MARRRIVLIVLIVSLFVTGIASSCAKPSQSDENGSETVERWDDGQDYPKLDASHRRQIRAILKKYGSSINGIYNYINSEDPEYCLYYEDDDKMDEILPFNELAEYILDTGHGVCYHYASLTYYLLTEAGYEALIIHGLRNFDGALHYWTMVKVKGKWYHFDPLHHQKLLTDSEKHGEIKTRGNGLTWQQGIWPTTE